MNADEKPIDGLAVLTDCELRAVAGGVPWTMLRSQIFQGSLDTLETPHGYQAWSWEQYYRQYVQQMAAGAPLEPALARVAEEYGFADWLVTG